MGRREEDSLGVRTRIDGGCIGDLDLAELLTGEASAAVLTRAVVHAADCEACGQLLACVGCVRADAGRADATGPDGAISARNDRGRRLRARFAADDTEGAVHSRSTVVGVPGSQPLGIDVETGPARTLGRYVVLETIGEGAMGQVMRAYDPKLRREVALKVVLTRRRADRDEAQARLLREAHALARLSHPNVVAVYDADTTDRGVAIAMEYVDGRTMRTWLGEHKQTWKDVVDVGIQIARGISAAHTAGLVHRDVKPDNVLMSNDGRVRVSDFGLARGFDGAPMSESDIELDVGDGVATLTETGQVLGTPAYMAPEQHHGASADARADQYALCVMLYEALHGVRPFRADNLKALAEKKRKGPPPAPPTSVPSWLHAATLRGLAPAPEARWPSVEALEKALAAGRRRRRRRPLLLAVGAVSAVAATWAGVAELDERAARSACRREAADFVEEFSSEGARNDLHAGISQTRASYAGETADKVVPMVDAYAGELQQAHNEACLSANVEFDAGWSADTFNRTKWCLDERRWDLSGFRAELVRGDASAVTNAVLRVAKLPLVQPCTDVLQLRRRPLPPAVVREQVRVLRRELSRARTFAHLGAYAEGLSVAQNTHEQSKLLDWPPLSAEARRHVGHLLDRTGEYEASAAELERAYFESMRAGAVDDAAIAATRLTAVVGKGLARHDDGVLWSKHAEALLATLPDPMRLGEAARLNHLGSVYLSMGSFAEAKAAFGGALEIQESAHGTEHVALTAVLSNIAIATSELGEHAEAASTFRRVLRIEEAALGPHHPEVGTTVHNLGIAALLMGSYEESEAMLERSLVIRRAALGEDHLLVASTLGNLGALHARRGYPERAREYHEQALQIRERSLPPGHPDLATNLQNLGAVEGESGNHAKARALIERALAIETRTLGGEHVDVAASLTALGRVDIAVGEYADATAHLERAASIFEAALGPDHPRIARPLFEMVEVALAEARPGDAVALAERAIEILGRTGDSPDQLAIGRFKLARAIEAESGVTAEARSAAELAHEGFLSLGPPGAISATEVEVWLQARPPADEQLP